MGLFEIMTEAWGTDPETEDAEGSDGGEAMEDDYGDFPPEVSAEPSTPEGPRPLEHAPATVPEHSSVEPGPASSEDPRPRDTLHGTASATGHADTELAAMLQQAEFLMKLTLSIAY